MDDARLGDGMTLEKIATELTAIREKLDAHDGKFASIETKLDHHDGKFASLEAKLVAHDAKFESLDGKVASLDGKVESIDARMRIGFEETHRLLKLGFESGQILDEKIDRRFDETERQHPDHKIAVYS